VNALESNTLCATIVERGIGLTERPPTNFFATAGAA